MSKPIQIRLSPGTKRRLSRIAAKESMEFDEAVEWALRTGLDLFNTESPSAGKRSPERRPNGGGVLPPKPGIWSRLQWRVMAFFYHKRGGSS